MQLPDRIKNAQQQAHELTSLYNELENRTAAFLELQESLAALREELRALQAEAQGIQAGVSSMQGVLPSVARSEELEQLGRRVDAIPFEQFATRKDV